MVFQGLDIVSRDQNKRLNIVGTVMDSCPGPRPEGTVIRLLTYGLVNWICSVKDGLPISGIIRETTRYICKQLQQKIKLIHSRYMKCLFDLHCN